MLFFSLFLYNVDVIVVVVVVAVAVGVVVDGGVVVGYFVSNNG